MAIILWAQVSSGLFGLCPIPIFETCTGQNCIFDSPECDQRVLSTGETNGTVISPNFPHHYPLNITCRYYIDGLMDIQNLEKAELTFDRFDLPKSSQR